MLMTVDELKSYITTTEADALLKARLQALEFMIRGYTHNNFQHTGFRTHGDINGGKIYVEALPYNVGDTVQITQSERNNGLYTVTEIGDAWFKVEGDVYNEQHVLTTKVVYPIDVKIGAANLMRWELENRDKVGVQSETISRHSVTYFNMDAGNSLLGYPKSLIGFLKPYRKVRF